jgi:hypothetical protein
MEEKKKTPVGFGFAVACLVVIGIAVLYFLSVGPLNWLVMHDVLPMNEVTSGYFYPARFLSRNCEPFGKAFGWYMDFFR